MRRAWIGVVAITTGCSFGSRVIVQDANNLVFKGAVESSSACVTNGSESVCIIDAVQTEWWAFYRSDTTSMVTVILKSTPGGNVDQGHVFVGSIGPSVGGSFLSERECDIQVGTDSSRVRCAAEAEVHDLHRNEGREPRLSRVRLQIEEVTIGYDEEQVSRRISGLTKYEPLLGSWLSGFPVASN